MFKKVKQKQKQNKVHGNKTSRPEDKGCLCFAPQNYKTCWSSNVSPHAVNGHFLFLFCQNIEISVSFSWEEHSRRTHHESLRPAY